MSEFSGTNYDFAAGSLFGLRGWGIDDLGRLHGVTHRAVWVPGENVATCMKTSQTPCPSRDRRAEARQASEAGRAKVAKRKKRKSHRDDWANLNAASFTVSLHVGDPSPVRIPCGDPACVGGQYHTITSGHRFDASCNCGFWAYDEDSFKPHGSVIGVIEAYGKTTIGTKGFRAEKARIVGICKEDGRGNTLSRSTIARLHALYPDALLCDDLDQMCTVFDGVQKTWADVGDDFWLQPVPEPPNSLSWASYLSAGTFTFNGPITFGNI